MIRYQCVDALLADASFVLATYPVYEQLLFAHFQATNQQTAARCASICCLQVQPLV
jgi:hypothetical protein